MRNMRKLVPGHGTLALRSPNCTTAHNCTHGCCRSRNTVCGTAHYCADIGAYTVLRAMWERMLHTCD